MGRPDPMQADHHSNPHQEEHDLYEQQQQFQSTTPFPPARNPGATQLYPPPPPQQNQGNANIPGGMYPPQAQQPPQMYPPPQQNQGNANIPGGIYPPQTQQQPQMYPLPAGIYPPPLPPQVYQQQQQYQQPVQFPPANPLPQVYQQPISDAPLIVQYQFNETITEGIPIQQQQKTYPSGIPTVGSSHTSSAETPTVVSSHNGWTTGLFGCMDDPLNAIITVFFPCLTFGQIAEMIDNGKSSCVGCAIMYVLVGYFTGLPCLPCLLSCTYRAKLRNQFNLDETPVPDCVAHFLCELCALCQAYRELSNRGFDPSIGWEENQKRMRKKKQQAQEMVAPKNQSMMQ